MSLHPTMGVKKNHNQCGNEDDGREKLYELFEGAKTSFEMEVKTGKKCYDRFVRDFIRRNLFTDDIDAYSKNVHNMYIGIVSDLLTYERVMAEQYVFNARFTAESFKKMMDEFDLKPLKVVSHIEEAHTRTSQKPLTLGCSLSKVQIAGLTRCAQKYAVFNEPDMSEEMMTNLFNCEIGTSLRVNNLRALAVMFDTISELKFITNNWKAVMERGGFLIGPCKGDVVSATNLSTALSNTKGEEAPVIYRVLRIDIKLLFGIV